MPLDGWNKFSHHLMVPRWRPKLLVDPFATIEIHSHCLMAIEFHRCHWMAIEFSHHAWQLKGFWSPHVGGDSKVFGCHGRGATKRFLLATCGWQLKGFWLPQCLSPPPPPRFRPLLHSPPPPQNGDWNPFGRYLVWTFHKKMGLLMEPIGNLNGTCWEQMEK